VTSPSSQLFVAVAFVEPLLPKNRATLATFVPSGLSLIMPTKPPFEPAVKMVVTVPVPSAAVFAAVTFAPNGDTGVPVTMGSIFVAIFYLNP
jgi:hypothetical protein